MCECFYQRTIQTRKLQKLEIIRSIERDNKYRLYLGNTVNLVGLEINTTSHRKLSELSIIQILFDRFLRPIRQPPEENHTESVVDPHDISNVGAKRSKFLHVTISSRQL